MSTAIQPIEESRRTLAAQVQARIREAILTHALLPGARIDQGQLANDLNVSLVPVREALKSLEAEGLVSIVPRRGAFVTEVSIADMDDLYFARKMIEGETIFHAVPNLNDDDFTEMERLISAMRHATEADNIRDFIDFNREFHIRIYEAANNRHILQMINQLWERSELYRYRFMFIIRNAETIHQEHDAILAACRARDQITARTMAVAHIHQTQQGLQRQLLAQLTGEKP